MLKPHGPSCNRNIAFVLLRGRISATGIWRTLKALGSETAGLQKVKITCMGSSFTSQSPPRFPVHKTHVHMLHSGDALPSALMSLCGSNLSCVPKSCSMGTGILHVCDWCVGHQENTAAVKTREIPGHTRPLQTLVLSDGFWTGTAPMHVAVRDSGTLQSKAKMNK